MNIFKKIFCGHNWRSHHKQLVTDYKYDDDIRKPTSKHSYYKEVLICANCGKIKTITY
jgi:hypothetical protein